MDNDFTENNRRILKGLRQAGVDFVTYVPCTILKHVPQLLSEDEHVTAILSTREEEAIGIAAGAYLGGKMPCAIMQSSGLGNSINALTSLLIAFEIPVLLLIAHRGIGAENVEAQKPLGKALEKLLHALNIKCFTPQSNSEIEETIVKAQKHLCKSVLPSAVLFSEELMRGG